MKGKFFITALLSTFFVTATAQAYFVRPVVHIPPGEIIDGLEIDGATSRTEQFGDAFRPVRTSVDLATGQMKLFAQSNGVNGVTLGAGTTGIMGDRIKITNGIGTTAHFTWGLDATVTIDWFQNTLDTNRVFYGAYMGIYDAGIADYSNWFGKKDKALFIEDTWYQIDDPTEDVVDFVIDLDVVADIEITKPNQELDVFYSAFMMTGPSNEWLGFTLDGWHTAQAGLTLAPGVTMTSASGVFLGRAPGSPSPVPEPGTMMLFGVGLIGLLGSKSRKKK